MRPHLVSWEGPPGLGQHSRRSQATPNPKRFLQRQARLLSQGVSALGARTRHLSYVALEGSSSYLASMVGVRGLRFALNTSVAVLVLSLPFAATAGSVATQFKVDPAVILTFNRCYFEPERCAAGQEIFVRGAALPALQEPERVTVSVLRGPSIGATPPRTGRLAWPVAGVITQYFWAGHTGVDLAAPYGTGIGASDDGVVSAAGWVAVGGLRVCLRHTGDLETCYYHTSAVYASVGQQVARGQIIAAIGLTGVTTGPHVHWECKLGNRLVNCLDL